MAKKFFFLAVMLVVMLLPSVLSVVAQEPIPDVYVDVRYSGGNESGSQDQPYNTEKEGRAYAQSLPTGARLHIIDGNGNETLYLIDPVVTGPEGTLLPRATFYALLIALAVVLLLVGWQFRRRAHQLES
jgi:preprotein translocase subunit SecF